VYPVYLVDPEFLELLENLEHLKFLVNPVVLVDPVVLVNLEFLEHQRSLVYRVYLVDPEFPEFPEFLEYQMSLVCRMYLVDPEFLELLENLEHLKFPVNPADLENLVQIHPVLLVRWCLEDLEFLANLVHSNHLECLENLVR
jgi:hypothetical protein